MPKPTLTVLEACHRLALIEGQKENKKEKSTKMSVRKRILIIARAFNMILRLNFSVIFDSGWRLCFPLVSSVSKSKGKALKKYRVEIFMIKPYEFVDEHFKIKVSEV